MRFTKDIERMSGGKFEVKFYEPGALIPPLECFDAVSKGSIESCWTTPGYDTGKYPALAFFTTVPFGPSFGEFLAWKWFGGGNKLRDEIYAKHGIVAVDCFCIGPETSGWFRKEVKSVDELKGLKMRFFGLGAQVMRSSASRRSCWRRPTSIRRSSAASSMRPSSRCRRWTSSSASTRSPSSTTSRAGTSRSRAASLLMNKAAWDALPDAYKAMIEVAGQAQVAYTYAETEAMQFDVMAEMRDKHKVQVKRWSDKDLAAFEKAWLEVLQEESAKDAALQEDRRPLPRLPQEVRHLGRRAGDEGDLPAATERMPAQLSAAPARAARFFAPADGRPSSAISLLLTRAPLHRARGRQIAPWCLARKSAGRATGPARERAPAAGHWTR